MISLLLILIISGLSAFFSVSRRQRIALYELYIVTKGKVYEVVGERPWVLLLLLPIVMLGFMAALLKDTWKILTRVR
jgi:hypothetical protein